jgi:hypothetical protein
VVADSKVILPAFDTLLFAGIEKALQRRLDDPNALISDTISDGSENRVLSRLDGKISSSSLG